MELLDLLVEGSDSIFSVGLHFLVKSEQMPSRRSREEALQSWGKDPASFGPLCPCGRAIRSSRLLASDQLSYGHCSQLGNEPVDGICLFFNLSLSLSVALPNKK